MAVVKTYCTLDLGELVNYMSIFNLLFISKNLEKKIVTRQLCDHVTRNNLYEASPKSFTETAGFGVTNDLLESNSDLASVLVLLDTVLVLHFIQ